MKSATVKRLKKRFNTALRHHLKLLARHPGTFASWFKAYRASLRAERNYCQAVEGVTLQWNDDPYSKRQ